jgi:hypothetical protein
MAAVSRCEGLVVNRKRLMRLMGLEAVYQKPNTSQGQARGPVSLGAVQACARCVGVGRFGRHVSNLLGYLAVRRRCRGCGGCGARRCRRPRSCSRPVVARESETGLDTVSVDHLARDHLKVRSSCRCRLRT